MFPQMILPLFYFVLNLSSDVTANNSQNVNTQILEIITSYMDLEENPCENFYQHACGNWEFVHYEETKFFDVIGKLEYNANREIATLLERRRAAGKREHDEVYRKVRTYYESCRQAAVADEAPPISTYLEILKPGRQVDWPSAIVEWKGEHFNWLETLGRLRAIGLNGVLFSEQLKRCNATGYIIELNHPHSIEFKRHEQEELALLVGNQTKFVELVRQFKHKVKQLKLAFGESRMLSELTHSELERRLSGMNFSVYFEQLLGEPPEPDMPVLVHNLSYLRKLNQLISKTEPMVVILYVKLKLLSYLRAQRPRSTAPYHCVRNIRDLNSLALDYIYEKEQYRYIRNESNAVIESVFHALKQKFLEIIDSHAHELNEEERNFLKLKINKMQLNIGSLPAHVGDTFYSDYYAQLSVEPGFFHWNHLNLLQHSVAANHNMLKPDGQVAPLALSFISWKYGSPMYDQLSNRLLIPYAYLQLPVFHRHFHELWLYAELGNTLGHEIMHGFDTTGMQYDAFGNPQLLFVNAMHRKPHFKRTLECLKREPTSSINEKLADFSGFRLAYETYFHRTAVPKFQHDQHLSDKQLFFIKFAQFFCAASPNRVAYDSTHDTPFKRVPQVLANSPDFSVVFNCSTNDLKKREHCDMW